MPFGPTYATELEAELALEREEPKASGITLGEYSSRFLLRRREEVTDWKNDESRTRVYIDAAPIAALELAAIRRRDVKDWLIWLGNKKLAAQTKRNALVLLRVMLTAALDDELIETNPAREVRISRKDVHEDSDEKWDILYPDEQLALLNAVPNELWYTVAFTLGTGVRPSEQWRLDVADIDLGRREVLIRKTKTSRPRRIPLFGLSVEAAREALERQKKGCPVAFPGRRNERRAPRSNLTGWHRWVKAAGITRRIRYYDLRHTCATSLLAGWWGEKWTLDELAQLLGHTSTKTTERYAHRLNETLKRRAESTGFHGSLTDGSVEFHASSDNTSKSGAGFGIRTRDLRFTNPARVSGFSALAVADFHERSTGESNRLAYIVLESTRLAYRGDDALAKARVLELLREGAAMALKRAG